jgi:hypothetical protein
VLHCRIVVHVWSCMLNKFITSTHTHIYISTNWASGVSRTWTSWRLPGTGRQLYGTLKPFRSDPTSKSLVTSKSLANGSSSPTRKVNGKHRFWRLDPSPYSKTSKKHQS